MADINSDIITNNLASPPVRNTVGLSGGRVRKKIGEVTLAGTQSNDDVMRFFTVRSNAVIHSLALSCPAISGATDVNFGLHTQGASGAAVDDNLFDDAQTLATALTRQEKRVQDASAAHSALAVGTLNLPVWGLLGLTSDPGLEYDVTGTLIAAGSTASTVTLEMEYTSGD